MQRAPATAAFSGFLLVASVFLALSAHAQNEGPVLAKSPDHPKTWVDGATRTHQSLRWSASRQLLVAYVTYSTADYADDTHPTQEDDFTLTFPTVHFDAASKKFTANGTVVARLKSSLFGDEVALEPSVGLSIHRHHGVVYGALFSQ
jgi:hypothetical protein